MVLRTPRSMNLTVLVTRQPAAAWSVASAPMHDRPASAAACNAPCPVVPGPEDDIGALGDERAGLSSPPSGVGIGAAFRGRLVGAQHPHARPGIAGAVLEAQPVGVIRCPVRSVDAGDHAGPSQQARKCLGKICGLVLSEA